MSAGNSGDRFRELEQAYGEYTVYDQHYEKVGKVTTSSSTRTTSPST
jgi:hypothetical protein